MAGARIPIFIAVVGLIAGVGHGTVVKAQPRQFTTLDVPGESTRIFPTTVATGINAQGDIVGSWPDDNVHGNASIRFLYHGFLLRQGQYTSLDDPEADMGHAVTGTYPLGINRQGDIVGYYPGSDLRDHGFLLHQGKYMTLNAPHSLYTYAYGINQQGDIIGTYLRAYGGTAHGFLLHKGKFTTLDDPKAVRRSAYGTWATGINGRGDVVGYYVGNGYINHGFLRHQGKFTTLNDPQASRAGGGDGTMAYGINDQGQVVGEYRVYAVGTLVRHGFLLYKGSYTTIDVPGAKGTIPYGINSHGDVVGMYHRGWRISHGFLWH